MDNGLIMNVTQLAERFADDYGKAIGADKAAAARKLKSITRAVLSTMEVGEEERLPVPMGKGQRGMFVLKKLGKNKLSVEAQ
jgi:hypothetical protein